MVELFVVGEPSPNTSYRNPTYRIPSAVVLPDRVIVAVEVRADWKDLPGDFDLVAKTSFDDGLTWSSQQVIRAHDQRGYGDASLLYDPVTDQLWCFYVSAGTAGFFTGALTLEHSVSTTRGESWTHLGALVLDLSADAVFAASGNGVAHSSGRLIQPLVWRRGDEIFATQLLSDDHGTTWYVGDSLGPDVDENKVVELVDGRLLLHARAKPRRRQAYSTDGGRSWTKAIPHPDLVDPACNGGLTRVGQTLAATGLNHESERADLVVRTSEDDGENWTKPVRLRAGACGYSLVLPLKDAVLVVFEDGDYQGVMAGRLTLAQCSGTDTQIFSAAPTGDAVSGTALWGRRAGAPDYAKRIAANPDRRPAAD